MRPLRLSTDVVTVSEFKAQAATLLERLLETGQPVVITQNGQAKAVVQDIGTYEQTQETMALLKILAIGNRQIEEGEVQSAASVLKRIRQRRENR